jgi:hypothetical protein
MGYSFPNLTKNGLFLCIFSLSKMMGALLNNAELAEIIENNRNTNRRINENLNNMTNEVKTLRNTLTSTQLELQTCQKRCVKAENSLMVAHLVSFVLSTLTLMLLVYAMVL